MPASPAASPGCSTRSSIPGPTACCRFPRRNSATSPASPGSAPTRASGRSRSRPGTQRIRRHQRAGPRRAAPLRRLIAARTGQPGMLRVAPGAIASPETRRSGVIHGEIQIRLGFAEITGGILAKPNYQFEKRQRDLAKKNKQEEKRRQKLADKANTEGQQRRTRRRQPGSAGVRGTKPGCPRMTRTGPDPAS